MGKPDIKSPTGKTRSGWKYYNKTILMTWDWQAQIRLIRFSNQTSGGLLEKG